MASIQKMNLATNAALAAASTNGTQYSIPPKAKCLVGQLQVASPNGATTVTAKIQHSPDGTSWFDYITFTATAAGAVANELKYPTNLPVLTYVRSSIVLGGATKLADVTIDLFFEPN